MSDGFTQSGGPLWNKDASRLQKTPYYGMILRQDTLNNTTFASLNALIKKYSYSRVVRILAP